MTAIDDHSVISNIYSSTSVKNSEGAEIIGGSMMGNTVMQTPDDLKTGEPSLVIANQEINPNELEQQSTYNNKPGQDVLHEVTEAYDGEKISQSRGISSPSSRKAGSVYDEAHNSAAKQTPMYVYFEDANGNAANGQVRGGTVYYFVSDPNGQKQDHIIHTIRIPR